jgi:hypothetical protein
VEIKYVSPAQLALRWAISVSSVYHNKGGCQGLRRIYLTKKAFRFLLEGVEKLEAKRLREANRLQFDNQQLA